MKKVKIGSILLCIILLIGILSGCGQNTNDILDKPTTPENSTVVTQPNENDETKLLASEYSGEPFVAVNDNTPYFTEDEKATKEFFRKRQIPD